MGPLILIGGIVLVVIILGIAAITIRNQRGANLEDRLGRYTSEFDPSRFKEVEAEVNKEKEKEKKGSALAERLDGILKARNMGTQWRADLARADLKLTMPEFLALHVISMFGTAIAIFFVLSPGNIVMTIIGGGIGMLLTPFVVKGFHSVTMSAFAKMPLVPQTFYLQAACALVVGIVAGIVPAYRAARVKIVDGLRHIG